MMTSAQVVETSVNVTSNSPSRDYTHLDDHNLPNYNAHNVNDNEHSWSISFFLCCFLLSGTFDKICLNTTSTVHTRAVMHGLANE